MKKLFAVLFAVAILALAACGDGPTEPPTVVPVASVSVTPTSLSLQIGQTGQLAAVVLASDGALLTGRGVVWTTSVSGIVTVSAGGLVTTRGVGYATITATSEGQHGDATVTVSEAPVTSVSVSPSSLTLQVGRTGQLITTLRDSARNPLPGRIVTWSSNQPDLATVNGSGLVTAQGPGVATIIATSEGKSGAATITVTQVPVATVTVTPNTSTRYIGQTVQLTAITKDSSSNALAGRSITWTTSASGAATVSGTGLVTAQGVGTATITATSEGQSGSASVTVITLTGTWATVENFQLWIDSGSVAEQHLVCAVNYMFDISQNISGDLHGSAQGGIITCNGSSFTVLGWEIVHGQIVGNQIVFEVNDLHYSGTPATYTGAVNGNTMLGTYQITQSQSDPRLRWGRITWLALKLQ